MKRLQLLFWIVLGIAIGAIIVVRLVASSKEMAFLNRLQTLKPAAVERIEVVHKGQHISIADKSAIATLVDANGTEPNVDRHVLIVDSYYIELQTTNSAPLFIEIGIDGGGADYSILYSSDDVQLRYRNMAFLRLVKMPPFTAK